VGVGVGVLLALDAGVDGVEVSVVKGVVEDSTTIGGEVGVDNGGTVVIKTAVESVLAGDGVEVEEGGADVDVVGRSSVVLVVFDIVKMRTY
jgi:hypothetical protein